MNNEEKILKIVKACMDLNTLSVRKREQTGYLPTVFFDFSGHVAWLSIKVYKTGWRPDANAEVDINIRVSEPISDEQFKEVMNALQEAKEPYNMVKVLEDGIAEKEYRVGVINQEIEEMKDQLNKVKGETES